MSKTKTTMQASDFSDAKLADRVAAVVLRGRFRYVAGIGWLRWDGTRWAEVSDDVTTEVVRQWAVSEFDAATRRARTGEGDAEEIKRYLGLLGRSKLGNVVALARGVDGVRTEAAELDADPWLLNTPSGVADLRTGQLATHDPALLLTRITHGAYRPGYTHPDWQQALTALDAPEQDWFQVRLGQAVTGHPTPDGIMPLLQGGGENGKSAVTTDGPVVALGDYGGMASAKLITAGRGTEHSTEMADLRGQRLLIAEEMTEGRALDVTNLKRIQDVGTIRARKVYRDNMTFPASHSLFVTSNYLPVVAETDHGTWRRLALLRFPYTFRKPSEALERPGDRRGDPDLKGRIRAGEQGQHDAIVTWVVGGAVRAHVEGAGVLAPTPAVAEATRFWRGKADRVLGAWDDLLVPDETACILATDLLDVFNEWLAAEGHRPWTAETFTSRFAEHSETRRHGVEQRQTRGVPGVRLVPRPVRGIVPQRVAPTRPRVWLGVRWLEPADVESAEKGADGAAA